MSVLAVAFAGGIYCATGEPALHSSLGSSTTADLLKENQELSLLPGGQDEGSGL